MTRTSFPDHTVLHVIAATLSLLLLAGMFSRCPESGENPVAPSTEKREAGHDAPGSDGEA
ncbi:MAG TPA: hypothetical protein VN043_05770 [Rhodanobacter sp.]|nr:hypothetical protein [Rhodanobacter sp.]